MAKPMGVDSEIKDQLLSDETKYRAVKTVIDTKRPRMISKYAHPAGPSLVEDAPILQKMAHEPCVILARLQDEAGTIEGTQATDFVAIAYVPEGESSAVEMQLEAGAKSIMELNYPSRCSYLKATKPEDITLDVLKAKAAELGSAKPTRKPIVGGNWKCNPDSFSKLDELLKNINMCDTSKCEVYVCPSPLHVAYCSEKLTNGAQVCPQNCNFKGTGAYTGEMAVEQMKDYKIEWCLIGHSERREYFKEDDKMLAEKLKYILDAGMKCVFCIGEKLPEREKGLDATMAVCIAQLEQVKGLLDPARVVIAYEPVWAIGTGVTATPEQAQETHAAIRKWIAANVSEGVAAAIRIQYGGSANGKNAPELSACPDIDGFLVGGAALKPEFVDIVAAISAAK